MINNQHEKPVVELIYNSNLEVLPEHSNDRYLSMKIIRYARCVKFSKNNSSLEVNNAK